MNWIGLFELLLVSGPAGYLVGLIWKKIDVLKLIAISVFLLFAGYVVISGFFFWADQYTIYRALTAEGICFFLGCLYFIQKDKKFRFEVIWVKRDFLIFFVIFLGFLISFEKFDYFGMGQDEGVYQVKAITLIYGHEETQQDFEEYGLLETDEQREEYVTQVKKLAGYDLFDESEPTLNIDDKLSPVSAIFHGIPTFPALLALCGDIFGLENMHQFHSVLYVCALLFLLFTTENLKLRRMPSYLVVTLAALCPVIQWVTKSTLTECGLYFIMCVFMYAVTSHSEKKNLFLTVAAIWTYGFFHVSTFAMMPMFVVLYIVLYFETGNRNYLYCNIWAAIGFCVGCLMMLYVSPTYSFNNINYSIGHPGDLYVMPIMLCAGAAAITISFIIDKTPLRKLYQLCRAERFFSILLRIVVIVCLCIIAGYAVKVHLGLVAVWRTDVQPYYQSDSILPIVQHLGIVCMSVALGVVTLPVAIVLLLIHPKEILKNHNTLIIGGMFLYCCILTATFMKKEIYYFYYYARYLAPFLVVASVGIGLLFNQLRDQWVGLLLAVSCIILLPFDKVLMTEKDDSRLEWHVITDLAEQIPEDGAVIIDNDYQKMLMLPIKAMTNADMFPLSSNFDEQIQFLEKHYDEFYIIAKQIPDMVPNDRCVYKYYSHYNTSEDLARNLNPVLLLPEGFTHTVKQVGLYQYFGNKLAYDLAHDNLSLQGFGDVEKDRFRWITDDTASFPVYIPQQDYSVQISMGTGIPLGNLGKDRYTFDVYLNDTLVHTAELTTGNMNDTISFEVSADIISEGVNYIRFAGETWSPSEYGSGDHRQLLISIEKVMFIPQ